MKYSTLLEEALTNLSKTLSLPPPSADEVHTVGASIGKWPAFPDTVRALKDLQRYYKLVPLTNCDNVSFQATLDGPLREIKFDATYVAENIGSYKPDLENFRYLLDHVKEEFGAQKEELLMTAHGLTSDHVPCKKMGITSAWIARGDGNAVLGETGGDGGGSDGKLKDVEGQVAFTWVFDTMGESSQVLSSTASHFLPCRFLHGMRGQCRSNFRLPMIPLPRFLYYLHLCKKEKGMQNGVC